MTLPPGDVDSGGGGGAITAGTLEGDDGGEVTDATDQPVEPQYQAALDAVNAAAADGDASSIDPTTALYAVLAQTPGVDNGVIQVADLAAPGGTALAAGVLANAGLISVTSETASALAGGLQAVETPSAGPGGLTPAVSLEVESVSAWEAGWSQSPAPGASGSPSSGGSDDNPTRDLVNSLYDLGQGLANPFGLGGVAANQLNYLTQLGYVAWDLIRDDAAELSLGLHALFGTPAYDPVQTSSFMQGVEAAADHGQMWSYIGAHGDVGDVEPGDSTGPVVHGGGRGVAVLPGHRRPDAAGAVGGDLRGGVVRAGRRRVGGGGGGRGPLAGGGRGGAGRGGGGGAGLGGAGRRWACRPMW